METTTHEREVRTLPVLDVDALRTKAAAWLEQTEAAAAGDPEKLLTYFAAEDQEGATAAARLDAVVHTLLTDWTLRRGANLAGALGTNRSGVQKIKVRAAKAGHEPVEAAPTVLPKVAAAAKVHSIRRELYQDAWEHAIGALMDQGWKNADIARLVGRDASRISHLRNREGTAA